MNFPFNNQDISSGNAATNNTGSIPQFSMSPLAVVRMPNIHEQGAPYCTLGCPCCIHFMLHNRRCRCSNNENLVNASTQTTVTTSTQTGEEQAEAVNVVVPTSRVIVPTSRKVTTSIGVQTEDEIGACTVDCDEEAFFTSGTTPHRLVQQEINRMVQKYNIKTVKDRHVQKAVSELFSLFPNMQSTDENFKRIKHRMRKMLNSRRYYDRLKEAAEEEGIPVKYMRQYMKGSNDHENSTKVGPASGKYTPMEDDSDSDNTVEIPSSSRNQLSATNSPVMQLSTSGQQQSTSGTFRDTEEVQSGCTEPFDVYVKIEQEDNPM